MKEYQDTYATFQWEKPAFFNFAKDVIDRWAEETPEATALWWLEEGGREEKRTFADLRASSCRLCNVLAGAGVRRGDVVLVVLGREIAWWEAMTACLRMGAVIAPGTTQMTAKDFSYRIQRAEIACVITVDALASKVDTIAKECPSLKAKILVGGEREGWLSYSESCKEAAETFEGAETRAEEDAICYFTSGTTGYPKMVLHTHTSYPLGHQTTGRFWLDLRPGDVHWNISDTGWAKAAWSSYFGPWLCGATVFVHHAPTFDPARVLAILQRYPITTLCGAPTVYRMLVLQDLAAFRSSTLRHCVGAGEPLNPEIIEIWKKATGLVIRDGYGQTETVLLCGNFPSFEPRFGSMGRPAPGIDLAVIDEEGQRLPPRKEGDIAVRIAPDRPLGIFKEYWKDPDLTASTRRGEWYLTGDRAYVDEDGFFWFVGRADDVIISAGYRIGPFEVESALLEHPAVAEAAAVASPDEIRGAVVKAFVILKPGVSGSDTLKQELQDHVKKVTAPYKYPRKIDFVASLPKTISGKIRRIDLREEEKKRGEEGRS